MNDYEARSELRRIRSVVESAKKAGLISADLAAMIVGEPDEGSLRHDAHEVWKSKLEKIAEIARCFPDSGSLPMPPDEEIAGFVAVDPSEVQGFIAEAKRRGLVPPPGGPIDMSSLDDELAQSNREKTVEAIDQIVSEGRSPSDAEIAKDLGISEKEARSRTFGLILAGEWKSWWNSPRVRSRDADPMDSNGASE
jgi:hypothetical protein